MMLITIGLLLSVGVVACSRESKAAPDGPGKLIQIDYATFTKMKEEKDTFLVIISLEGCSYCEELKETILNPFLSDVGAQLYEFNISNESSDEKYQLAVEGLEKEFAEVRYGEGKGFQGTPTTVVYEGGERVEYFVGNQDLSIERFEELRSAYELNMSEE